MRLIREIRVRQQDKRVCDTWPYVPCAGFAGHEHEVALQQSCSIGGAWLQVPAPELQMLLLENSQNCWDDHVHADHPPCRSAVSRLGCLACCQPLGACLCSSTNTGFRVTLTLNLESGFGRQVLALELLKVLLENSGPVFRSSEKFTAAIKQYLILSLIRNAGSPFPQVGLLNLNL